MPTTKRAKDRPLDVRSLARLLVARMRDAYNADYIKYCETEEPESLLGLCARLEAALDQE